MSVGRLCSQDGHKKAEEGRKGSTMRSTESDSLELHVPSVEENTRFPLARGVMRGESFLSVVVLNPP